MFDNLVLALLFSFPEMIIWLLKYFTLCKIFQWANVILYTALLFYRNWCNNSCNQGIVTLSSSTFF